MPQSPDNRRHFIVKHGLDAFEVLPNYIWRTGKGEDEVPHRFNQVRVGDRWVGVAYTTSDIRERPLSRVTGFFECVSEARYGELPPPAVGLPVSEGKARAWLIEGKVCGDQPKEPVGVEPIDDILERKLWKNQAIVPITAHDLLAGEQIDSENPRRWLLITREMSVPDEEDGTARWSLDHLFLDQDAVPTLVEVKRSTDTRIRREVVGQMLDYAANAVVYWPVEDIRAKFEIRCEKDEENPDESLTEFLGDEVDIDEFWQRVKTNLQAGRIRLVFLSDSIPSELRRVVEFLNEQMDPAEVLAIEFKQFVGKGVTTFVPRVLGQTEAARQKKSSSTKEGKKWDEALFMAALEKQKGEAARKVAEDLLHWIEPQVTHVWWGVGSREGGIVPTIQHGKTKYHVCRMATQGWFVFRFDWLCKKPPFNDETVRKQLLAKINEIPGMQFGEDVLKGRARIPFEKLTTAEAVEKLKSAVTWLIEQVNSSPS